MRRKTLFLGLLAATGLLAGCSFAGRDTQLVTVTVTPADARVIANGVEYHNISPQIIQVYPKRGLVLTAYKPGYREANYVVDTQLTTLGTIDACASILIFPYFGLFSSGAWELAQNNIYIELQELPSEDMMLLEHKKTLEARTKREAEYRSAASHSEAEPPAGVTTDTEQE